MDLTSWLGTFMLERVLGTVPVEEDGSAYFEVPAGRTVLFVALDGNDLSVKRMQSFTNVQPGEVLSCVGCHEHRALTPASIGANRLMAVRRPPSRIEPFEGLPDVLDYRRHIQPILNGTRGSDRGFGNHVVPQLLYASCQRAGGGRSKWLRQPEAAHNRLLGEQTNAKD
ncbi:MAG: HzsA-related protein [Planctomycetota bacterium]